MFTVAARARRASRSRRTQDGLGQSSVDEPAPADPPCCSSAWRTETFKASSNSSSNSSNFSFRCDGEIETGQIFLCIGVALRCSEPKEPPCLGQVSLPALAAEQPPRARLRVDSSMRAYSSRSLVV